MTRLYESADLFIIRKNSAKTKDAYKRALLYFGHMKFGENTEKEVFKNLNTYIKKANLQTAIDDIYLFKEYLAGKKLAIRSIRLNLSAIQSWFANNNLPIPKNKSREIRGNVKPITDDKAYTTESAKQVFDEMKSPMSRCLFLFLLSTGCRIGEALQVRLSDVNWESNPVIVNIDETTTKTGEGRQVFLTSEAAKYIKKVWLTPTNERGIIQSNRDRYLNSAMNKPRGLINMGIAHERPPMKDDNRLWPFCRSTAYNSLITANLRAGFDEKTKTGTWKLHPHSTRKFFRTAFGMAAGPDAAETLLGHSPGLASSYRKLEMAELIELWKKHEISLHINISPEARMALQTKDLNSAAIAELREENKKLKEELTKISRLFADVYEESEGIPHNHAMIRKSIKT